MSVLLNGNMEEMPEMVTYYVENFAKFQIESDGDMCVELCVG